MRANCDPVSSVKEEDADGRKQDSLPPESAPVLDDSVSSLLFSVPAESSADSTTLHISDRKTIEASTALLVRTQPVPAARCRPDTAVRAGRDQRRRRDHTCDRLVRRQGRGLHQQHGYTVLPRARRRRRVCRLTGLPKN